MSQLKQALVIAMQSRPHESLDRYDGKKELRIASAEEVKSMSDAEIEDAIMKREAAVAAIQGKIDKAIAAGPDPLSDWLRRARAAHQNISIQIKWLKREADLRLVDLRRKHKAAALAQREAEFSEKKARLAAVKSHDEQLQKAFKEAVKARLGEDEYLRLWALAACMATEEKQ